MTIVWCLGGSRHGRELREKSPRLLTNGDEAEDMPLLANEPHVTQDDGVICEPDLKRPRLDLYKVALAATEVYTSYAEAMASSEAKQRKEAICKELRAQSRLHLKFVQAPAWCTSYRVQVSIRTQI
ncbi:hypothetical protein Plhal703r1_c53g0158641 [Plasmopara halstedii]